VPGKNETPAEGPAEFPHSLREPPDEEDGRRTRRETLNVPVDPVPMGLEPPCTPRRWRFAVGATVLHVRSQLSRDPLGDRRTPLNDTDLLVTIAEISVAFVGFAGLISVLGSHSSRDPRFVQAIRFRVMVLTSLSVAAFALLPLAMHRLGLSPEAVWRSSSALFFVVGMANASYSWRSVHRALRIPGLRRPPRLWFRISAYSVALVVAQALLAATAAGLAAGFASGLYTATLLLHLESLA